MAEYPRFKAHAYISYDGRVTDPRLDAWALCGDIWVHGPMEARFVVVESVEGEFLVWEYDGKSSVGEAFRKDPPEPRWRTPTADAAVMKALALR